ncbi:MAG: hypothetical protein V2A73_07990 [Pseudomonadota bacterium]
MTDGIVGKADAKHRPEAKLKAGAITATIWKARDEKSKTRLCVFERTYKDKDGNWANTSHFSAQDVAAVALLAKRAFDHMVEKE